MGVVVGSSKSEDQRARWKKREATSEVEQARWNKRGGTSERQA